MESVLRATVVYVFLLVVFRIAGKRSLAQITTFDFVLLLIIGEATQQALLGDDYSVVNACIVIGTLIWSRSYSHMSPPIFQDWTEPSRACPSSSSTTEYS